MWLCDSCLQERMLRSCLRNHSVTVCLERSEGWVPALEPAGSYLMVLSSRLHGSYTRLSLSEWERILAEVLYIWESSIRLSALLSVMKRICSYCLLPERITSRMFMLGCWTETGECFHSLLEECFHMKSRKPTIIPAEWSDTHQQVIIVLSVSVSWVISCHLHVLIVCLGPAQISGKHGDYSGQCSGGTGVTPQQTNSFWFFHKYFEWACCEWNSLRLWRLAEIIREH